MARRRKIAPAHELDLTTWAISLGDIRRFLSKIEETPDGHWLWKGGVDENGYACFHVAGSHMGGHRFACALFKGRIPALRHVHHTDACGLKSCVNPNHLKPLTPSQNSRHGAKRQWAEPKLPFGNV